MDEKIIPGLAPGLDPACVGSVQMTDSIYDNNSKAYLYNISQNQRALQKKDDKRLK